MCMKRKHKDDQPARTSLTDEKMDWCGVELDLNDLLDEEYCGTGDVAMEVDRQPQPCVPDAPPTPHKAHNSNYIIYLLTKLGLI